MAGTGNQQAAYCSTCPQTTRGSQRAPSFTRGEEEKEFTINAGKVWVDAKMNVTITIRLPAMDSFTFSDGGLTSDFLSGEEVVHYLHENREGGGSKANPV